MGALVLSLTLRRTPRPRAPKWPVLYQQSQWLGGARVWDLQGEGRYEYEPERGGIQGRIPSQTSELLYLSPTQLKVPQ